MKTQRKTSILFTSVALLIVSYMILLICFLTSNFLMGELAGESAVQTAIFSAVPTKDRMGMLTFGIFMLLTMASAGWIGWEMAKSRYLAAEEGGHLSISDGDAPTTSTEEAEEAVEGQTPYPSGRDKSVITKGKHVAGSEEIYAVAEQINAIADRLENVTKSFKI